MAFLELQKMPYKVVQTVERGKPVLTAVPQAWERDGTLYWPKYQADKLIKVDDLYPEENWITIPCELKRDNIRNYEEAQIEISSMLYGRVTGYGQNNRNQSAVETSTPSTSHSNFVQLKFDTSMQDPLVHDEQTSTSLSAALELIMENQRIMLENQKKIMKKIAEFSSRLDTLTSAIEIPISNICPSNDVPTFTPIDSLEALDEFENDLKDSEKRNVLYNRLSPIFQGHGKNSAYYCVDMLFNRKFLTKCSWAGGSRGEESKIPFKIYNNTINFFHNIVRNSDQTFSQMECQNFFKTVLRNAVKRAEAKGLRASHRKNRSKHLCQTQVSYESHDGDEFEESRDGLELAPAEYSPRKRRKHSDVETSEAESDEEKDLNPTGLDT